MPRAKVVEIFILLFLGAALIAGALVFNHFKFEKPNTYNIIFKDIDSIVKGSPVRFMGINVGYVLKLRRKDDYIICKIRITKRGVKIPNLTRAKVAFNGLGGSKSVELLQPLTNDNDLRGIVADESLRINDFGSMIRTLTEISVFVNKFVQELDTESLIGNLKAFTNPRALDKIDDDIQKAIDMQAKSSAGMKNSVKTKSAFSDFIDYINTGLEKFWSKGLN